MSQLHPLRKASSGVMVLSIDKSAKPAGAADHDIEASIATIGAVGGMLDRMQGKLDEQAALIARLSKEVDDLAMHKEAAYSEMAKAEAALRVEQARAERAEQSCQDAVRKERDARDKLGRLISSVRETFGNLERDSAA